MSRIVFNIQNFTLITREVCLRNKIWMSVRTIYQKGKNKQLIRRKPVPFPLAFSIHKNLQKFIKIRPELPSVKLPDFQFSKKRSVETIQNEWKDELSELSRTLNDTKPKRISHLEYKFERRINELGLNKSLQVADLFFARKYRQENFITSLFDYAVDADTTSISPEQLTHLMFYVFFHGSAPTKLYSLVEEHLLRNLDDFSVNSIGIICLGYFRSHTRILSYELMDKIGEKVLSDFDKIEDEGMLINILKTFRHSGFAKVSFYERLADLLVNSSLSKFNNLNSVMHIAMVYASSRMCCSELNKTLLSRFVTLVRKQRNIRSKDIAKFVWAMGTFVHDPSGQSYGELVDVYRSLSLQQERVHPESLADMLLGLNYLNIHPHDLLDRVFQPATVNTLKSNVIYEKAFQLLLFYNTVQIECPDYTGTLPSKEVMDSLESMPRRRGDLEFEMGTRKGLREISDSLQKMFGKTKIQTHFILPQFTLADIEMRLDINNCPVEFTPSAFSVPSVNNSSQEADRPSLGACKVAIEVLGHNQYFVNTAEMTGNIRTKLRQLKALNYKIIVIAPNEASQVSEMTEEDRQEYLRQTLSRELNLNI